MMHLSMAFDAYGEFDLRKLMNCILKKIGLYGCIMKASSKFEKFDAIVLQAKNVHPSMPSFPKSYINWSCFWRLDHP